MRWTERRVGDVVILDLQSRLTRDSREDFRQIIENLLRRGENNILVSFKDSGGRDPDGVEELVSCFDMAAERNAIIKLLNLESRIDLDLILFTRLISRFEQFHDEAEAIASFGDTKDEPKAPQVRG